jgi:hypothetical protein
MEPSVLEDSRGVDIGQVPRQLRMSVPERVRYMVEVTNRLMEVRASARFVDARPKTLRDGLVVVVADLDDIIASKVAANRPKDHRTLPYLESLREQLGEV